MNFLYVDQCNNYTILKVLGFVGYLLLFIQIIIPIILIVMGTIDLVKALTSSNHDKINNSYKTIIKRFIYGVIIFFVPMLIKFSMNLISQNGKMETCFWAISNPGDAIKKSEVVRGSFSKSGDYTTKEACEATGRKWILTHSEVVGCQDNGCYICVEKGN